MSDRVRVFLAHPKAFSDEQIEHWTQLVSTEIRNQLETEYVEVVPGRDDYNKFAPAAGGFPGWVRDVPTRRDAMTSKPYYSLIVVPTDNVGKATAMIVQHALHLKMPVIRVQDREDGPCIDRVAEVVVEDPEDFTGGWFLEIE